MKINYNVSGAEVETEESVIAIACSWREIQDIYNTADKKTL